MAAIEGKITMSTCEGRPCWVRGRRAIFHRWTDSARPVKPVSGDQDTDERLQKWSVHGLVEYEDGRMEREWPNNIRFADSAEKFDSLEWEQMEARRDAMDNGEETAPPTLDNCLDCAHYETPDKEKCIANGFDCIRCEAECIEKCIANGFDCIRCEAECICNDCTLGDKWEPRGGAV